MQKARTLVSFSMLIHYKQKWFENTDIGVLMGNIQFCHWKDGELVLIVNKLTVWNKRVAENHASNETIQNVFSF